MKSNIEYEKLVKYMEKLELPLTDDSKKEATVYFDEKKTNIPKKNKSSRK